MLTSVHIHYTVVRFATNRCQCLHIAGLHNEMITMKFLVWRILLLQVSLTATGETQVRSHAKIQYCTVS